MVVIKKNTDILYSNDYGVVYLITNLVNKKRYIGITTRNIEKRIEEHTKANSYIGRAIRKYGYDSFNVEILDSADNKENLKELEKEYIKKYNSFKEGYNLTVAPKILDKLSKEKRYYDFCTIAASYFYLLAVKPKDKKTISKQIIKMREKKNILNLIGVSEKETEYYSKVPLKDFKEYDSWAKN